MKVMVIVRASKSSEAGEMPSTELLTAMGKYNEQLANAGIILSMDGLHPSSKGARVRFSGANRTVTDGPFAETKELIAGYWLWRVNSMQEAIEWVKKCPNPMTEDSDIEIRRVFEAADFGAEFTPELREQEAAVGGDLKVQGFHLALAGLRNGLPRGRKEAGHGRRFERRNLQREHVARPGVVAAQETLQSRWIGLAIGRHFHGDRTPVDGHAQHASRKTSDAS